MIMVEANELSESHGIRSLRFKSQTQRNFGEVVSDLIYVGRGILALQLTVQVSDCQLFTSLVSYHPKQRVRFGAGTPRPP